MADDDSPDDANDDDEPQVQEFPVIPMAHDLTEQRLQKMCQHPQPPPKQPTEKS